ncbi:MAG: VCBS repeat-containing protein [Verrucomicrobia bacterium]|nr:VCBS repeat-containing protein [Verrucomicrobiota bacterium]MBI3867668.1 VCBS repeat-containing protein [Verrucomicrobiota bacterium]
MKLINSLLPAAFGCVGALVALLPGLSIAATPLKWSSHAGYRSMQVAPPSPKREGFTRLSPESTGVRFTNHLSASAWITNVMLLNGSGVAAGDVDGDGWCDLFFCRLEGRNALYRNLGGERFELVPDAIEGEPADLMASGCAFADIDGDGDLDLIVNSLGQGTFVFMNDGRGHFTKAQELNRGRGGTSLALADIDGDGDLDLYVANYRTWTFRDRPSSRVTVGNSGGHPGVTHFEGRPVSDPDLVGRFQMTPDGGLEENGDEDLLALNDGKGHFTPVSFTDGRFLDEAGVALKTPPYDWGMSVMMRDLNGDGAPDIYVCNDFASPDRIWINDGKGNFRAMPTLAIRSSSRFSMGMDVGDLNRDGFDDLFVVDMLSPHHGKRHVQIGNLKGEPHLPGDFLNRRQYSRNTLLLNRGDGTYAEIGNMARVSATEWTWGVVLLDVDLDGYEDILGTTGNEIDSMNIDVTNEQQAKRSHGKMTPREVLELRTLYSRLEAPKIALRNRGDLTFENAGARWGFDSIGVAHGICLADLDNDGDLDVVVNSLNGPAEIYRNECAAPRVQVRLMGRPGNTQGIGARLKVSGGPMAQTQEVIAGGRYLSGDQPIRAFAANTNQRPMTVEVIWRDGTRGEVSGIPPNQIVEISQQAATPSSRSTNVAAAPPLFENMSALLRHTHHKEAFDDFERQPLLPYRLSQLGPGVCWHDVDGDGWEDLLIGGGKGGAIAVFKNQAGKAFELRREMPFGRKLGRDQTTILASGTTIFAGSSNYEDGSTNGGGMRLYSTDQKVTGETLPGLAFSVGPMAMADIDQDGDLDLFIGGRVIPGRYPEAAPSHFYRNDGGRFFFRRSFESLGLVTAALFTDLDGDGRPELVVACEWGSLRVFKLTYFDAREITSELGLDEITGRWSGLAAGDFDNDGRMDLVVSNWGLNGSPQAFAKDGLRIVSGDFSRNGNCDLLEAYQDRETSAVVPSRLYSVVENALPFLKEKVPTFEAYARMSVSNLLGDRVSSARWRHARRLESMVFLNRGGRFEARALPAEAQWAPGYGVSVADFDGDGNEDLFLAQNLFALPADQWRMDAGRGLLLRGDGHGGFDAMPGQLSGVQIYGEQRGCAAADFDQDGRVDLVVGQNAGPTQLLRNRGARPGVRVRLRGSDRNTDAVGAQLRMRYGDRQGPMRESHMGSGHWSQDGSVMVFADKNAPTELEVHWPPRGEVVKYPMKPSYHDITVRVDGTIVENERPAPTDAPAASH